MPRQLAPSLNESVDNVAMSLKNSCWRRCAREGDFSSQHCVSFSKRNSGTHAPKNAASRKYLCLYGIVGEATSVVLAFFRSRTNENKTVGEFARWPLGYKQQ